MFLSKSCCYANRLLWEHNMSCSRVTQQKLGNRFVVLSGYEQTKLRSGSIFVSLGEPFPLETQKKDQILKRT